MLKVTCAVAGTIFKTLARQAALLRREAVRRGPHVRGVGRGAPGRHGRGACLACRRAPSLGRHLPRGCSRRGSSPDVGGYKGTSFIRKRTPLGPYRMPLPSVLGR